VCLNRRCTPRVCWLGQPGLTGWSLSEFHSFFFQVVHFTTVLPSMLLHPFGPLIASELVFFLIFYVDLSSGITYINRSILFLLPSALFPNTEVHYLLVLSSYCMLVVSKKPSVERPLGKSSIFQRPIGLS
jgi:hypothetical protein